MCVRATRARSLRSLARQSLSPVDAERARAASNDRWRSPRSSSTLVRFAARSSRRRARFDSIRFDSIHPFDRRMIRRPRLVDIDWRVGVTASTSETNASGASRVSVRLTLEEDADDGADDGDDAAAGVETSGVIAPPRPRRRARRRRFERVEMSVTQFYALARELDKASAALDAHAGARRG